MQARIRRRRPLIERLLKAEAGSYQIAFLDNLRVVRAFHLQTQVRLLVGDAALMTEPETASVKLDGKAGILYLAAAASDLPWTAVARELALAIQQDRVIGGLAIGIKELLAADTEADAAQLLDELGYPSTSR